MNAIRRRPGLASLVLGSLTLTICASTALFSVADRALWRRLRFDRVQDIVLVQNVSLQDDFALADAMAQGSAFDAAATYEAGRLEYRYGDTVERVNAAAVSGGLFGLLGVRAVAGRLPGPADERAEIGVAVLGEHLWRQRFGGAQQVLGQVLVTADTEYRIVGVVPAALDALGGADILLVRRRPFGATPIKGHGGPVGGLLGRLRPRVRLQVAVKEVATLALSLPGASPDPDTPRIYRLADILGRHDGMLGWGAGLGVFLLFLVGTLNAGLLYVGWLEVRRMEVATKMALGAGPWRLLREFIGEWCGLAVVAGFAGFVLSLWTERLAVAVLPSVAHYLREPRLWSSVGCAAVAALLSAIAIGLMGYLGVVPSDARQLSAVLGQTGTSICGAPRAAVRRTLVTMQMGIGVALLGTSLVLSGSLTALVAVAPGFDAEHMLAFSIWRPPEPAVRFPGPGKPTASWLEGQDANRTAQRRTFYGELQSLRGAVPSVAAVGAGDDIPWTEEQGMRLFVDEGHPRQGIMARVGHVEGAYFEAVGTQLRRGRTFQHSDLASGGVAVVDEVASARLWPGANPVGQYLHIARGKPRQVIGVVAQIRSVDPRSASEGAVYVLNSDPVFSTRDLHVVVGVKRMTAGLIADLQARVRKADPAALVFNPRTGREIVDGVFGPLRAQMSVFWLFAGFASVLCGVGVFGSTTQWLLERRREMALRVVLGASRHRIVAAAVRQVVLMAGCAGVGGIAVGWVLLRVIRTTVLGVEPTLTALLPGVVLAVVAALVTAYVAAWRMTRGLLAGVGR
jgi:predicted permease